ncbi:hypothetical protein [Tellurirhabdus bombi]|uniref:hypothetical protein n=1 Tax=Tellurirhabdus bombi TaxID=2907205 RepID=UPI001F245577|nr:hypothetical protein [Tellurirhabdus bombi]
MISPRLYLLLLFFLLVGVVALKVADNPAFFSTPDSRIYVDAAEHLKNGQGYYIDYKGQTLFNTFFPIAYSALIVAFSWLTTIPVDLSAKAVNLLAIASLLVLFSRIFRRAAPWVGLVILSSTFVHMASCTWSETAFLTTCVAFSYFLFRYLTQPTGWVLLGLFLTGYGLFLFRYIGLFSVGILALFALLAGRPVPFFKTFPISLRQRLWLTVTAGGIFLSGVGYMWYEHLHEAPQVTASQPFLLIRWAGFGQRLQEVLLTTAQELLFFIRDWDSKRVAFFSAGFWTIAITTVLQFAILARIVQLLYQSPPLKRPTPFIQLIWMIGLVYYVLIISLYLIQFDLMQSGMYHLYYRYYFPATTLFVTGLLGWLSQTNNQIAFARIKGWLIWLFALSLFHSLPKSGLFNF